MDIRPKDEVCIERSVLLINICENFNSLVDIRKTKKKYGAFKLLIYTTFYLASGHCEL